MPTQDNRYASVTTPLGKDILLFQRMTGHEEISRLFEYEVDLLLESTTLSSLVTAGFPIDKLLGAGMTVSLSPPSGQPRHFHGHVAQFRHYGTRSEGFLYRAVLRPWLWFLTRTSNCRIYQEQSVPEIISDIFKKNGFSDFRINVEKTYPPRSYCVQYRESDFNFVSRLMEYEGLFYYFEHTASKHTLIISDSNSRFQTISGYDTIPYYPPENSGQREEEHIYDWQVAHKIQSGSYELKDYAYKMPASNPSPKKVIEKTHAHATGKLFDYPGNYCDDAGGGLNEAQGNSYCDTRINELHTDYEVIEGAANTSGLSTGMLFTLSDHFITPENAQHVVVYASFYITSPDYTSGSTEEAHFECHFKAIRHTQPFKPQRLTPTPIVQGPQTAVVVGKQGEEIWTDDLGRVKVQFFWDREGKKDEVSSCWVRVAYPVAGKKWGWVSLPRIGQEVVVSFLEGNPDRPLITGSVYNSNITTPYTLPENATQSGIKTHSSKEGSDENFNELRFEDKKGSEEIYVHAEKDFNCVIENNETRKIGLDKKDKGDQTIEIQNHRTVTLKEGDDTLKVEQGSRTTTIYKDETLTVKTGNRKLTIEQGNDSKTISVGNHSISISQGKSTIEAMQSIELIVGSSSIKLEQSGITIKGAMISIEGSAKLDAKSPLTTVSADGPLTLKGAIVAIN